MGRSKKYLEWDEHAVGDWLKSNGLEEYAPVFVENKIKGRDLSQVISDTDTLAGTIHMQTVLEYPTVAFIYQLFCNVGPTSFEILHS